MSEKMSLLARYDDMIRYAIPMTAGYEDEFIKFIQQEVELRKCIVKFKEDNKSLRSEISKIKAQKEKLELKLNHTKFLLEEEILKKTKFNAQRKCLQRQISIIKDVLLADHTTLNVEAKEKLAFLDVVEEVDENRFNESVEESTAFLSSDDYSDGTDEELGDDTNVPIRKSKGKRKSSQGKRRSSHNKRKSSRNKSKCFQSNEKTSQSEESTIKALLGNSKSGNFQSNRCYSESAAKIPVNVNSSRQIFLSEVEAPENSPLPNENLQTILQKTRLSLGKKERKHSFVTKTIICPESCNYCNQKIKFYKQAIKCQDCRVTCHPECQSKITSSCNRNNGSQLTKKRTKICLMDFAYHNSPMIPEIIIQCTSVIESTGLNDQGLYRISGREKDLREVRTKLLEGKCIPCLGHLDVHTVCCVVKEFFRLLEEPLVVPALWKEFANAIKTSFQETRNKLIGKVLDQLPQPNKETLAFMVLHLNQVAESPKCMMPISNLAKVLGPTIVGHSASGTAGNEILEETKSQVAIMENILKVPLSYWKKILLDINEVDDAVFSVSTPEVRTSPAYLREGSKLGPIQSVYNGKNAKMSTAVRLDKTSLSPRKTSMVTAKRPKKYFPSPLIQ